jgi:hypothetical protein
MSRENRSAPIFRAPIFSRFFSATLLLLAMGSPVAGAAAETTLADIDGLRAAGAQGLALRLIDGEQPAFAVSPVAWQRWEQRRLAILESRQDWSAVIQRTGKYPSTLPDDFRILARESALRAHLARGDAEAATALLANLIWGTAQDTARVDEWSERLSRWRGLLAESYSLAGQLPDARTAVLRYRLDYGDEPSGWRLTHAKALLREGYDSQARQLLIGLESTEVAYMKLLLRARNGSVDPVELLSEMGPFLGEGRLVEAERAQVWASLASAAARYRDHEVRVTAMEQAVALSAPVAAVDEFVQVDADALWDAYAAYGAALANDARLLVGRFDDWLALAEQHGRAGEPKARALYAYLATQGRDARVANKAQKGLVSTLTRERRGLAILGGLYLKSSRYAEISSIPAAIRAPLIAYAVGESRFDVSRQLLAGLDADARSALSPRWRGPVAVALIVDGRVDEALALFGADFDAGGTQDPMAVDGAVEVALALQAAGEHEHAAVLLSRLPAMAPRAQQRRELQLLAAEAEDQAGHHERAARLYLESTAAPDGGSADAWSYSASLQAARALARAGLVEDAVAVLRSALANSPRADQRVLMEHVLRRF